MRGRGRRLSLHTKALILKLCVNLIDFSLYVNFGPGRFISLHANSDFRFVLATKSPAFSTEVIEFVDRLEGDVCLDIGANVGLLSIPLSRRFRVVHSFEPDTRCLSLLRENLEVNNIQNVIVHEQVVSQQCGEITFSFGAELGHSTVEERHITRTDTSKIVLSTTIDEFATLNQISLIDLVKIDVEGHEYEVLLGASKLLSEGRIRTIVFEHSPTLLELNGKHSDAVFLLLDRFGYQVKELDGHAISLQDVADLGQTDLMATPRRNGA